MSARVTSGDELMQPLPRAGPNRSAQAHYVALAVMLVTVLIAFAPTFGSMLTTWLQSNTYQHGVLIFPVSAYLIWRKSSELHKLTPSGFWPGCLGLLMLSLVWWLAYLLSIQVVMQLATIAMISMVVVTVMGLRYARTIAFPLGYLIFAVPFGEVLVPHLVDFTAAFTVNALNLTGIPVVQDGRYFSIPAGDFEVARACSGIRYLLATVAFGTLLAYMNFESIRRRILFVLFTAVVAIVANGVRAYVIVLLAEYVSLDIAAGADHIVFGWIFFSLIVVLMILAANRFSDRDMSLPGTFPLRLSAPNVIDNGTGRPWATLGLLAVSLACVLAGPVLARSIADQSASQLSAMSGLPSHVPGWSGITFGPSDWSLEFHGATREVLGQYKNKKADTTVDVAVIQYSGRQRQGSELASSDNLPVNPDVWRINDLRRIVVRLNDGNDIRINEAIAQGRDGIRVVWYWYDINGMHAASNLQAKLKEAKSLLTGLQPISSVIAVSIGMHGDPETGSSTIREFICAAYGPIHECVNGLRDKSACTVNSYPSGN